MEMMDMIHDSFRVGCLRVDLQSCEMLHERNLRLQLWLETRRNRKELEVLDANHRDNVSKMSKMFQAMPTQTEDGASILVALLLQFLPMFGCLPDLAFVSFVAFLCISALGTFSSRHGSSTTPSWKCSWHLTKASSKAPASTGSWGNS